MSASAMPHLSPEMSDGRVTVAPGVELAFIDRGAGPVIVFVPGWTFTKEIFEKQIADLSLKYRVISFDPRSQGASSFAIEGNDYLTHAQDLTVLLNTLKVKNPVLVGWMSGAHTTWGYIKLNGPESIAAHICIDMPPRSMSSQSDAWAEGTLDEISAIHNVYLRDARGQSNFVRMLTETIMIQRVLEQSELDWILTQSVKCNPLVAAQLFASWMFSDNTSAAVAIARTRPTMFFLAQHWGAKAAPYLRRMLPESRLVVFGGRMMFWEYHEAFNRSLDEFIQMNVSFAKQMELN